MSCNKKECSTEAKNVSEEFEEQHLDKKELILYIISIIIFASSFLPFIISYIKVGMYIISIVLAGYELIISGIKNMFKLNFEEDTLMAIAIIAACCIGEFAEGCLVIILFKLGEFIENIATNKSNKNINEIVKIKAKNANLMKDNEIIIVDVNELKIGDNILIKPGEMIPVDCKILKGTSELDTSNITGESREVLVNKNEEILSGTINLTGSLTCEVMKTVEDSTASQIIDLVYEATNNKGKTEKFITKFSRIYTPIVIILAVFIAIVPSIFGLDLKVWLTRALVFLVASCPCSIVISIPLAFFSCIGTISKRGMLIKGTTHIENLAKANIIAFDKTGTITTGNMEISSITSTSSYDQKQMLSYMYALERNSNHPISTAISDKIEKDKIKVEDFKVENYKEIAGHGIYAEIDGKNVLFGNEKLLQNYKNKQDNIEISKEKNKDTNILPLNAIFLVIDGKMACYITLMEQVREGASTLVRRLNKIGIKKIIMLTGDNKENANKMSKELGLTEVYSSLLPKDKLDKVEKLKKEGKVIFVGDGINDSPVLATADFSIAMGTGTEIAGSTADSILISNNINSIVDIIKIARSSMRIIKFNIIFSILLKVIVLILGVLGYAPIWLAVFADVGVTLITVMNSIRIYKKI